MTAATDSEATTRVDEATNAGTPGAGERWAAQRRAAWPAAIVLAPLLLIAWCFWPGHMSADTLAQIQQADTGQYTNQHAPILMALWHPFYDLGFGPGWALTIQLVVFGAACYLLLRSALRPMGAATATALLCLSPVVFGMLGYLSRDVWFTELTLLTFACVLGATRSAEHRRRWVILALVAAWLTLASRQNAGAAIFPALAILIGLLLGDRVRPGARRVGAAIAGGLLVTVVLMASLIPVNAVIGTRDIQPTQYIFIYDVAALSHQNRENLFPRDVMPRRGLAPVDKYWNVDSVNTYLFLPDSPIRTPLPPKAVDHLRSAWIDAVTGDPLGYLAERWDLMLRQLAIGRRATFIYHPVLDPNGMGLRVVHPEADRQARDYVEGFADENLDGGVLYPLWLYLAASVVAGVLLLRTRTPALVVMGALGIAGLTLQAGLFIGAMGTQYRFEFPLVVIALLCTIVGVSAWRARRRETAPSAQPG